MGFQEGGELSPQQSKREDIGGVHAVQPRKRLPLTMMIVKDQISDVHWTVLPVREPGMHGNGRPTDARATGWSPVRPIGGV